MPGSTHTKEATVATRRESPGSLIRSSRPDIRGAYCSETTPINPQRFEHRVSTTRDLFLRTSSQERCLAPGGGISGVSAKALARSAARHGYQFGPRELLGRVHPLTEDTWQTVARKFDPEVQSDKPDTYVLFLEEVPMSKDAISAFFKKAAEDTALQKKLVELAAAEGFDFSADELNDADLDSIAGGVLSEWKGEVIPKIDPIIKK